MIKQVGPVLPLTFRKLPDRIDQYIKEHNDKPILYMCMGTVATITSPAIQELVDFPFISKIVS